MSRILSLALCLVAVAVPLAGQRPFKVYISVDMEGITGLVDDAQMSAAGRDYGWARQLMIAEANAAIAAAFEAGATEVLVNDSHGGQTNLLPDLIDPRASLITGQPKPLGMAQGIDSTFAAALYIGYHARGSTADAVHDHTFNGNLKVVKLNGREIGEYGLNSALAGYYGVPVVFISGDRAAVEQAREFIPGIETLAVKEAIGHNAARTMHPKAALEKIQAGVKAGLSRRAQIRPVQLARPVTLEIELAATAQADAAMLIPGVQRVSGRTVRYSAPDLPTIYRVSRAIMRLSTT